MNFLPGRVDLMIFWMLLIGFLIRGSFDSASEWAGGGRESFLFNQFKDRPVQNRFLHPYSTKPARKDSRPLSTWAASDGIDFNRDVRPILSTRCYQCHGPDEASLQAELRLDSFAGATADLGGYAAIVPGDVANSELINRVCGDDDSRMPPAEHGPALTEAEIARLRRWVEAGAVYDRHWSYQVPRRPKVPADETGWSRNAIDRLVLEKMSPLDLTPSPEADRYSLVRRVSLDLTGLPPSIKEVNEFVLDPADHAFENMVDRFMSKPAFGEKWASMWLDQARYADSMGYAEDRPRAIWAYRDYVIRSLNENKPFDQFTIEQLAGDLLPNPTDEQIVATAFHRNTLTNTEGGTIDEEFRSAAIVDRVNTTMAVWMGTTMACAQCHTHKYDPLTQNEYYQFYAFFNQTEDNDQPEDQPIHRIFSGGSQKNRVAISREIESLRQKLQAWKSLPVSDQLQKFAEAQQTWERELTEAADSPVAGRFVRLELNRDNAILSIAEVQVISGGENVAAAGTASQSSEAFDGPARLANDGNTDGKFDASKSVTHTATESNPWWELDLLKSEPIDRIAIWNRTDGELFTRMDGLKVLILDEHRNSIWSDEIATAEKQVREITPLPAPQEILELLQKADRSELEQKLLNSYFAVEGSPEVRLNRELDTASRRFESVAPTTTVPVMQELPASRRRETRIHHRGNYLDLGEVVSMGTPKTFHPLADGDSNRLELARWLVSIDNPLTARVTVNRLWQQLFGNGLVTTSEDFGTQGELPSHPELLDYLACEFMDQGWDIKSMLKLMITSATYRQQSNSEQQLEELDPSNRWLARGPRFRLTAEMVRDQALHCSGLLSSQMFGPPVQPPQPQSGLKIAFRAESTDWIDSLGPDRYRRAIYTRWQRSNPYPSMTTFDLSGRDVCELQRIPTNTPLQALVTLNDPVFFEAAQALARRIKKNNADSESLATHAFRLALIRPPSPDELGELLDLYQRTKQHFELDRTAAAQLATDPLNPIDENTDLIDLAAWTVVANLILNLDETFVKP